MRTYYNIIDKKTGAIIKENKWCYTDVEEGLKYISKDLEAQIIKRVDEHSHYDTNIINNEESFTGKYIKDWCEYHIKHESIYEYEAQEIYNEYWDKDNKYKPNSGVYYFVDRYRKYNEAMSYTRLHRDTEKSPKKAI
jgi:hypothetical protein